MSQSVIIGVDEAGMGALAGPLVVAATAFLHDAPVVTATYQGVRKDVELRAGDSKGIKKPEHITLLSGAIRRDALACSVLRRSVEEIDANLISRVLPETIRLAVARIMEPLAHRFPSPRDYLVLLDGELEVPGGIPCEVRPIAQGDKKHWQIGAASILAKESYDGAMLELAARYPAYGFESNKGYPTPDHKKRLKELGPSKAHRKSFRPVQVVRPPMKGLENP